MRYQSLHLHSVILLVLISIIVRSSNLVGITSIPIIHAAGMISSDVFRDFNANSIDDGANEIGVAGVTVTAYDTAGAMQGTLTTAANGNYTLNATGTGPYRIEFTNLLIGYFSEPEGPDSGRTIQFVPDGNTANVNLGMNYPADDCQANPDLCASMYINGGPNTTEPTTTLWSLPYINTSNIDPTPTALATKSDIGSTWGSPTTAPQNNSTLPLFSNGTLRWDQMDSALFI